MRLVPRSPGHVDPLKDWEREDDANNGDERLRMKHPGGAKVVVHPTVRRCHLNDRNISERRERRVFRGSSTAADGEQHDRRKSGVGHSAKQRVNENADREAARCSRCDSYDNCDGGYGNTGTEI